MACLEAMALRGHRTALSMLPTPNSARSMSSRSKTITLVLVDKISLGAFSAILRCSGLFLKPFLDTADHRLDNLAFDTDEALWAAGVPDGLAFISAYYDLEKVSPSSAIRITRNVGKGAFFGENLKVEKVWRRTPLVWCKQRLSDILSENRYSKMM